MKFSFKGGPAMQRTISRVARGMPGEMASAEHAEATIEMTEMKRRTPVWNPKRPVPAVHTPGSLRDSGQVHEPEQRGKRVETRMTFGNDIVDYPVYVHEDLEAEHATGQAKFMESVLNESAQHMGRRLANRIDLRRLVGRSQVVKP